MRRGVEASAIGLVTVLAVGSGCVGGESGFSEELDVSCSGKCDGIGDRITSIIRPDGDVPLTDLAVEEGLELATDELNDLLAFGDVLQIEADFESPQLYRESELDAIVTGLAARFGERELSTVVNRVRRDHLAGSGDEAYAEAAFGIRAGVNLDWDMPIRGLAEDGAGWLGFAANREVRSRVIAPVDSAFQGSLQTMLQALQQSRHYVLPRNVEDIAAMHPGELFALSGEGRIALNVGASVPIVLAEPVSVLTYRLVFSAALGTVIEGTLDVEVARLEGNEVVVDVGVTDYRNRWARVAIHDGWGVTGLCDQWPSFLGDSCELTIAGREVNLAEIAERALRKRLDRHLNLLEARAERSSTRSRLSVARLRFELDPNDEGVVQALSQALQGDVRFAQALANRNHPGVVAELDLSRSGVSSTSYVGLDFLGMRFFDTTTQREGVAVVQTPGGGMSLMFDSLHNEAGAFWTRHAYSRVGMAGLVFDANAPGEVLSHANLLLQLSETDDYEENDDILDHIDALIVSLAGFGALTALEDDANEIVRRVERVCGSIDGNRVPCYVDALSDPEVLAYRDAAVADFSAALPARMSAELRDLLVSLAELRVNVQATGESAGFSKPGSSLVVDFRLDNNALTELVMQHDARELTDAVIEYLRAVAVERASTESEITKDREDIPEWWQGEILNDVEAAWTDAVGRYEARLEAESTTIAGIGALGPNAIEISFPVDSQSVDLYEDAVARSLSQARAAVVTELFDRLIDVTDYVQVPDPNADRTGATETRQHLCSMPEQAVVYALLSLLPPERTELRVHWEVNDLPDQYETAGWGTFDEFYRGEQVSLLDGAMFDLSIDSIISTDQ